MGREVSKGDWNGGRRIEGRILNKWVVVLKDFGSLLNLVIGLYRWIMGSFSEVVGVGV